MCTRVVIDWDNIGFCCCCCSLNANMVETGSLLFLCFTQWWYTWRVFNRKNMQRLNCIRLSVLCALECFLYIKNGCDSIPTLWIFTFYNTPLSSWLHNYNIFPIENVGKINNFFCCCSLSCSSYPSLNGKISMQIIGLLILCEYGM